MKKYKVTWREARYGTSSVLANNEEEAKEKAKNNQDFDWEEYVVSTTDWEITDVEEDEDNECFDCGTCDSDLVEVKTEDGKRRGVCSECAKEYK